MAPFKNYCGTSAFYIFPILINPKIDRVKLMAFLKGYDIQTSIRHPPVHLFSYHKKYFRDCAQLPVTDELAKRQVTLKRQILHGNVQ